MFAHEIKETVNEGVLQIKDRLSEREVRKKLANIIGRV